MSNTGSRTENGSRPPLLNGLIVVTLVTIVVALVYLGNYFLGDKGSQRVSWYPLNFSCKAVENTCHAFAGINSDITLRLHDNGNGTLDVWGGSRGLVSPRYEVRVTNLSFGFSRMDDVTLKRDASHFKLDLRSEYCPMPSNKWRLELLVTSTGRSVGTWSDVKLPCVKARPSPLG